MNSETWKIFFPTLKHLSRIGTKTETRKTFQKVKETLYPQKHRPELLNNRRIYPIIHTSLPLSYEENHAHEENFIRPLPESTEEEYKIKSIIPEEKDVLPTYERQRRLQPNIHLNNLKYLKSISTNEIL